ncbi:MAG TPA: acyl carrier protein [Terriglobales bacterium]|nr:acyl carrier protein [Dongiaceae bacterium]HVO62199.1 acyl carrier protein [Terriglobales bacterium]
MVQPDVNALRTFIANNFLFCDDFPLSDAASFMEAGILDSVGVLQIILFLEERYRIKVADEEIVPENLDSILGLAQFVGRKLTAPEMLTGGSHATK